MSIKNNALRELNSLYLKIWLSRLSVLVLLVICGLCVTDYSGPIDILIFMTGSAAIALMWKSIKIYKARAARALMYYQSYTQTIEA